MKQAFPTMGTVASLVIPGCESGEEAERAAAAIEAIQADFEGLEERFSLYRDDSEASRIARGELPLTQASVATRDAYALALEWRQRTAGAFTPHRPDGVLDLAGVVKAMAIADGGRILDEAGFEDWILNIGGDLLSRGRNPERGEVAAADGTPLGERWKAGIVDPANRGTLLGSVELREGRRAIATSGIAERGEHVWRAERGPAEFVQVSVRADDIVTADVLATAILSGGPELLHELVERYEIDVLACDRGGAMLATPGMREALAA